jgi:polyisoprenyl-teichoic acid--peptidoglycan teichoic acid transferase
MAGQHSGTGPASGGRSQARAASHRRRFRRARTLGGALGVTLLGAVLPGAGMVWTRRRAGYLLLVPALGFAGYAAFFLTDVDTLIDLAVDPGRLRAAVVVIAVVFALWAFTVVATYLMARPRDATVARMRVAGALVVLACVLAALPVIQSMRYALTQADLVDTVFTSNQTATAPRDVTEEDPWKGRERVNLLILGGDGGVGRTGVRTDTVILLSVNTRTGRSVMFSLPRNMMNAQFPVDSPLHDIFPDGFTGAGDASNWMLNAVYGQVPALYPGILGKSDNEGADAIKQAVGGSLGVIVDYYLLVNLLGFQQIVDAVGGVTVNINEPVAINGDTGKGIPPTGYLEPGPNQHLDGFHALWFARGRWGSDDYERMLRQRCVISALIDEVDPVTLLRQYQALAEAGKEIVRTDIPKKLLPAFVDLGLRVKEKPVRSIAFVTSDRFFSGDPDFDWIRSSVQSALQGPPPRSAEPGLGGTETSPAVPATEPDPGSAVDVEESCAYQPEL